MAKGIGLSDDLHKYVVDHGTPPDTVLSDLIARTHEAAEGFAMMQIAPEQGAFMTVLTRIIGARNAVEVGTFTGYSALCIARGLTEDGKLLCLDVAEKWTNIGREAWGKAGVSDKIEVKIGPAAESLAALPAEPQFDLAFIDADKTSYETYLSLIHERLNPGGVVLVDNVLWGGNVIDPDNQTDDTKALRAFNTARKTDDRFDCVLLPISDGLTILRKR